MNTIYILKKCKLKTKINNENVKPKNRMKVKYIYDKSKNIAI